MSTLTDTNILARSAQPQHPMHQAAVDSVANLHQQGEDLCVVPQILYEFWVVCTRPLGENGLGMTAAQAQAEMKSVRQFFKLFDDTPAIFAEWEQVVNQHQVMGKKAHDAHLVAAMRVHGVGRILTFNTQDFQRYQGIVVVSPAQVLAR